MRTGNEVKSCRREAVPEDEFAPARDSFSSYCTNVVMLCAGSL